MCATYRQEEPDHVLWWATSPEDQAELEHYARKGVLVRIGDHKDATDGLRYALYREKRCLVTAVFEDLEAEGLLARTGETRAAREGRIQPVYVHSKYAPKKPDS